MWDRPYAVIRSGPGKVMAAAAAQAAVQYLDPAIMFTFGTAGCPDKRIEPGTLSVATTVADVALSGLKCMPVEAADRFKPDAGLTAELLEVPGAQASTLVCWEGHVVSPLWRPLLNLDAADDLLVVDWESAAVAQVAQLWGVPWAALKVISDHGEGERLQMLALVAKRHLQWGAEVIRRAAHSFFQKRTTVNKGEAVEQVGEAKESER